MKEFSGQKKITSVLAENIKESVTRELFATDVEWKLQNLLLEGKEWATLNCTLRFRIFGF